MAEDNVLLSLAYRKIVLLFTCGLLDTPSTFYSGQPLPPFRPALLFRSCLALFWDANSSFLVVKNPETYCPWCQGKVD